MAEGYHSRDSRCIMQLHHEAVHAAVGMTRVRLRVVGGSTGEANKSGSATAQEGTTGFYGLLFDLE